MEGSRVFHVIETDDQRVAVLQAYSGVIRQIEGLLSAARHRYKMIEDSKSDVASLPHGQVYIGACVSSPQDSRCDCAQCFVIGEEYLK